MAKILRRLTSCLRRHLRRSLLRGLPKAPLLLTRCFVRASGLVRSPSFKMNPTTNNGWERSWKVDHKVWNYWQPRVCGGHT